VVSEEKMFNPPVIIFMVSGAQPDMSPHMVGFKTRFTDAISIGSTYFSLAKVHFLLGD